MGAVFAPSGFPLRVGGGGQNLILINPYLLDSHVHLESAISIVLQKSQDKFDHDKGQKSAISGRRLHWRLSTGFFAFSPVFMCNLVRQAP